MSGRGKKSCGIGERTCFRKESGASNAYRWVSIWNVALSLHAILKCGRLLPLLGPRFQFGPRRKMAPSENDVVAVYTLAVGFISNVNHFINYLAPSSFCIENYIFEKI